MNKPWVPFLLGAPTLIFVSFLFLLPLALMVATSLVNEPGGGLSFDAYTPLFTDPYNREMIWRTLRISLITTALTLVIAFPVALHMRQMSPRWSSLISLLLISPLLTSVVVRTLAWIIVLGPRGVLNTALIEIGLSPVSLIYNEVGVIIGLTHVFFGYMVLSLMASMSRLDGNLLLAAQNLGANQWVILRDIVIPLNLPGIIAGSTLVFTMSASTYATPALLGGSGAKMMATEIFSLAIDYLEWREAAAVAVVLFIIVALVTMGVSHLAERGRRKVIFS